MNVDMEKIERIEKFVSYGFAPYKELPVKKLSLKNHLLGYGLICCFVAWRFFEMAYREVTDIESANVYHLYWAWAPILLVAVLSIIISKRMMNKGKYKKDYDSKIFFALFPAVGFLLLSWFFRVASHEILAVVFILCGLVCVFAVCTFFYRVYLIQRYKPHFKDACLRV